MTSFKLKDVHITAYLLPSFLLFSSRPKFFNTSALSASTDSKNPPRLSSPEGETTKYHTDNENKTYYLS